MARYQILRKLATGGMAEVFLGRAIGSSGFQKPVAIKRILPHLAADAEFVRRFHDEARLTVHLQHSNVVQVFDLGQNAADHLMVLEFVDGDTLRALLKAAAQRQVPLPFREMAFIIQQIAEGLAYAHEVKGMNIVHRDINPANIMVSQAGAVKLADFGIARAALAQSSTATGVVRGKVGYFAPEVARGADPDQRSDVFLMGLMLYEVFTGQRLFREADFVKSLVEVGHFDARTLKAPPHVPGPLWEVLKSTLHADPAQRMPSARQLALSLSSFLFENRLRVGPTDVAALFAKVFPDYRSALATADAQQPLAEVDLVAGAEGATPPRPPASDVATRTGVIPLGLKENDFDVPAPSSAPRPAGIPRATQGAAPNPLKQTRPPKPRLGELLLARKVIDAAQLEQALSMQRRVGGKLGDVLVSLSLVKEDDLFSALAEQRGHRFVRSEKLEKFELSDALKPLLTADVAQRLQVLPLSIDEKRHLFVAMADPADLKVLDEVRSRADVSRVSGVMIRPKVLERLIERCYLGRIVDLDLPAWAGEQAKMIERYGATTSDVSTRSREQVFGEDELGTDSERRQTLALPVAAPAAPLAEPSQASGALEPFMLGAAAREDPLGTQAVKLQRLVRGVARRVGLGPAAAVASLERQAVVLFMAGQLEHRRPYEPPHAVTARQLLGEPGDALEPLTAEKAASARFETKGQQVLAAVFGLGAKLGDLDAPAANAAAALLELQGAGRVPVDVLHALSAEVQAQPAAVAIVASAGSALFALAPVLSRSGHRVVVSTRECFERARPDKAIIDATLQQPPAFELVQRAVKGVREVCAVAPAQSLPLIAAWKGLGVTTLAGEDLRAVVGWVEQRRG